MMNYIHFQCYKTCDELCNVKTNTFGKIFTIFYLKIF